MAVLWLSTSLGEACDISEWLIAPLLLASPVPEPDALEGPCPAGGPPPECERCAKAGELQANVTATNRTRCVRFTDASYILFSGLKGKAGWTVRPCRGSLLWRYDATKIERDANRRVATRNPGRTEEYCGKAWKLHGHGQ